MWARIVEILLGVWLIASPSIFRSGETGMRGTVNDLLCGILVVVLAVFSFSSRLGGAHFLILLAAAWLVINGYVAGHPAPAAAQNLIITGLLLAMFAIIPNHIDKMPRSWREFYSQKR